MDRSSVKLTKPVEFDTELEIKPKTGSVQRYRLVAIVRHRGETTHSGHYTTDVRYDDGSEEGAWLHCNDSCIDWVETEDDLFECETPYLLFYVSASSTRRKPRS